jgi:hypothetical protein
LNDIRDFLLDNIAKLEKEILMDKKDYDDEEVSNKEFNDKKDYDDEEVGKKEFNNKKSNNKSDNDDSDDSDSGGSDVTITPSKYAKDLEDREKMDIDKSSRSLNSESSGSENNYWDKLIYCIYIVLDSIHMLIDYSLDFFNNFL